MSRITAVLILIGTFACSALALDPKLEQIDREQLRKAVVVLAKSDLIDRVRVASL
jgi:hypothetical protein